MIPELTQEQPEALQKNHGFLRGSSYVLISMDKYREMMGVGSDGRAGQVVSCPVILTPIAVLGAAGSA